MSVFKKFSLSFWIANVAELFERWAWYGFYMAFALYLVGSKDTGALGFSSAEKGLIMGTGSMMLYLLPIITGAISDRIGYKLTMLVSFVMYLAGYFMVGTFTSFWGVYLSFIFLAAAGATFKPIVSAVVSRSTTAQTSSIGFGIFYMMVNIGGFIGPFIVGAIYQAGWSYVFYLSMATIAVNFLFVLFFFRDEHRPQGHMSIGSVLATSFANIGRTLVNWRYVLFLLIMVIFWSSFNMLYYSFPVFADEWIDTSSLYAALHSVWPWLAEAIGTAGGTISAVTLTSFDSFFIIVFQIAVSGAVMRFKPLTAMMIGITVLAAGLYMMFAGCSGWLALAGLLVFSLGEMASSPKFTEYVGSIAPADQKALYMGTSFLPIAVSHSVAGVLSGGIYDRMAGRLSLLRDYAAQHSIAIDPSAAEADIWQTVEAATGQSHAQLTQTLWDAYDPASIGAVYAGIALLSVVLLLVYDRTVRPVQQPQ